MTDDDPADAVSALLAETETAHGVYETRELGGVYDQDWARWYALYAVEHGLGGLLGHDVPADRVAAFLARAFDDFKTADPKPTSSWAPWMARRIRAEL